MLEVTVTSPNPEALATELNRTFGWEAAVDSNGDVNVMFPNTAQDRFRYELVFGEAVAA
jgi:hypothetical protein